MTDKARIVSRNNVHFVINCFISCRVFVLIVQFPVSATTYDTIDLHVLVYTSFYLFTFLIAAQKILLVESVKASKHLQPHCAQQALAGGLGGGIVPPLVADGGSNEGEDSIEEDEPDNDED